MLKLIAVSLLVIVLISGFIFSPKNTLNFIKEVSVKTIDLFVTIYKEGKPVIEDINKKVNKNETTERSN